MANIRKVTEAEVRRYCGKSCGINNDEAIDAATKTFNALIFGGSYIDERNKTQTFNGLPLDSMEGRVLVACGICGNLCQESHFKTWTVDFAAKCNCLTNRYYKIWDCPCGKTYSNEYFEQQCERLFTLDQIPPEVPLDRFDFHYLCYRAHRGIFQTSYAIGPEIAKYSRRLRHWPTAQVHQWLKNKLTLSAKNVYCWNGKVKDLISAFKNWRNGLLYIVHAQEEIYERAGTRYRNMENRCKYSNEFAKMSNELFGMKIRLIQSNEMSLRCAKITPAFDDGSQPTTTPPPPVKETPSTPAPRPTTPRVQTPPVKTTIIPTPSFTNGTSSVSSICEAIINHRHVDQQSIGQQTNATPTRQVITTITPDDPRSVLETFGDAQPTKPTTPKPTTSTAATTNNTNNDATQYTKIKMGKNTAWEVTNGKDGAVFLVGDSQMNTIANKITLGSTYFSYAISGDGFDVKDKIHNRVANGELPWFIEDKSSQSQSQAKAVDSKITVQSYGYNYTGTINAWGSSHWGEKKSHYVRLLGADGQVKQILKKYKPSKIICWCGHNTADANKKLGSVKVAELLYNHYTTLARYIKSNSPRTKFYIFPIAEIHQYKWSNSSNPNEWFYNIANAKLRSVPNATFVGWPSAWGSMDAQVQAKDPHIQWKGQASGKAGSWLAMCT